MLYLIPSSLILYLIRSSSCYIWFLLPSFFTWFVLPHVISDSFFPHFIPNSFFPHFIPDSFLPHSYLIPPSFYTFIPRIETKTVNWGSDACSNPKGPMHFVSCRLYPFSTQPPRQCLGPTCHLSTRTLHRRCGLANPYDWRCFVGPKKKTSVGGPLGIHSFLLQSVGKIPS